MRVELKIDPACQEPCAVINAARLTPNLQAAISLLEKEGEENVFPAQRDGKTYLIEPDAIEIIRTEGRELALYDRQKRRFLLNRPLYELEKQLGKNFVRISKSALVSIRRISHVEASFNGTMELVMKNGVEEVITRSYRQQFKQRLGYRYERKKSYQLSFPGNFMGLHLFRIYLPYRLSHQRPGFPCAYCE